VLAVLEEGIDRLGTAVRQARDGGEPRRGCEDWERRVRELAEGASRPEGSRALLRDLPDFVTACLSQAEEDILIREAAAGTGLTLLRVAYPVETFDVRLRALVAAIVAPTTLIATVPEPPDAGLAQAASPPVRFCLVLAVPPGAPFPAAEVAGEGHRYEPVATSPRGPERHADEEAREVRGVSETLRVPVGRLDAVTERVGELSLALAAVRRAAAEVGRNCPEDRALREFERVARSLATRLAAVQRSAIDTRLVPLHQVYGRLARLVALTARDAGREVEFSARGGETEIDKRVMDELAAPLVHLVRNAVGHGIETPPERAGAGKPRRGRVEMRARALAGQVLVEIEDDGRGVSPVRVAEAAARRGIPVPPAPLSIEQACELLFVPGFSTSDAVSELSGRGVGLDAVRRTIRRLRGSIVLRSRPGEGTTVALSLPISLALLQALIVRSGSRRFAIPLSAVRENLRIEPARLRHQEGRLVYEHPRGLLPLRDLEEFGAPAAPGPSRYAVVAGPPDRCLGLLVEECLGQQEVILRRLGRGLQEIAGVAGATELGDATAVLVLDPDGLMAGGCHGRLAA
jgi:two-component system chemotaxis sensor kinase CheA